MCIIKVIIRLVLRGQSHTHSPHPIPGVPGCMELPPESTATSGADPQSAQSARSPTTEPGQKRIANVFPSSPEVDVNVFGTTPGKGGAIAVTHAPYVCTCVVRQDSGTG